MPEGQAFNLVISVIVSAAAGTILGVSLTSTGGNALVGTAISAGLLPPLVNAGMLMTYSLLYMRESDAMYWEMGYYAIAFYASHVITIVIAANFVFYLKDIDPRFREGEESNFTDLMDEKMKNLNQREKFRMFVTEMKGEASEGFAHIKGQATTIVHDPAGTLRKVTEKGTGLLVNVKDGVAGVLGGVVDITAGVADVLTGGVIGARNDVQSLPTEDPDEEIDPSENSGGERSTGQLSSSQTATIKNAENDIEMGAVSSNNHGSIRNDRSLRAAPVFNPLLKQSASVEEGAHGRQAVPSDDEPKQQLYNASMKDRLRSFYSRHNPDKVDDVPAILLKYEGKEQELFNRLKKQYNVDAI